MTIGKKAMVDNSKPTKTLISGFHLYQVQGNSAQMLTNLTFEHIYKYLYHSTVESLNLIGQKVCVMFV